MTKEEFRHIVHDQPKGISNKELAHLENLITNFPYCQVAHILVAKAYKDSDNMLSSKKIRTAAAYTANRRKLKHFIQQEQEVAQPTITPQATAPTVTKKEETPTTTEHTAKAETVTTVRPKPRTEVPKPEKNNIASDLEQTLAQLKASKKAAFEHLSRTDKTQRSNQPKTAVEEKPTPPTKTESKKPQGKTEEKSPQQKVTPVKEKQAPVSPPKKAPATNKTTAKSKAPVKKATKRTPKKKVPEKKTTAKKETQPVSKKAPAKKQSVADKKKSKEEHIPSSPQKVQSTRTGAVLDHREEAPADTLLHYLEHAKQHRNKVKKKEQIAIIDEFIKKDPSIKRNSANETKAPQKDLSAHATRLKSIVITENMAKINLRQGNDKRAIEIYNELMLKYPEKKGYFASQIDKINK